MSEFISSVSTGRQPPPSPPARPCSPGQSQCSAPSNSWTGQEGENCELHGPAGDPPDRVEGRDRVAGPGAVGWRGESEVRVSLTNLTTRASPSWGSALRRSWRGGTATPGRRWSPSGTSLLNKTATKMRKSSKISIYKSSRR